jgi:hypothetical protein
MVVLVHRTGIELFAPLEEYIIKYNTRYSDRVCWAWIPCRSDEYVEQLPVDDGLGYLVKQLICKPLSRARSANQYLLVDGYAARYVYLIVFGMRKI